MVIDGKVFGPFQKPYYSGNSMIITGSGKYAFAYRSNDYDYINMNGKIFGPYGTVYGNSIDNIGISDDGNYFFTYTQSSKRYTSFNGSITDKYIAAIAGNGNMAYYSNDKKSITVNGTVHGPYIWVDKACITSSGHYGFAYMDKDFKRYANVDGKILGPYAGSISELKITDNGKYALVYEESYPNKYYADINGKIFGPYRRIRNVSISNGSKYVLNYQDNDRKEYTNINGSIKNNNHWSNQAGISDDGKLIASYRESDDRYVIFNEKTYGPYSWIENVKIADKSSFGFRYSKERTPYYNVNGNGNASEEAYGSIPSNDKDADFYWIHRGYSGEYYNQVEVTSSDRQHSFFSDYAYEYVVIDGQPVGKSPALYAWYNESNNSFVWNVIEGKELVVYEYRLP